MQFTSIEVNKVDSFFVAAEGQLRAACGPIAKKLAELLCASQPVGMVERDGRNIALLSRRQDCEVI
jgi:hypothetical protein